MSNSNEPQDPHPKDEDSFPSEVEKDPLWDLESDSSMHKEVPEPLVPRESKRRSGTDPLQRSGVFSSEIEEIKFPNPGTKKNPIDQLRDEAQQKRITDTPPTDSSSNSTDAAPHPQTPTSSPAPSSPTAASSGHGDQSPSLANSPESPAASSVSTDADEQQNMPNEPAATATEADTDSSSPPRGRFKLAQMLGKRLFETICLGAFLAILAIVILFALTEARSFPKTKEGRQFAKLPATGTQCTITQIETFWRQPLFETAIPDRPKYGMRLLPVVKISINSQSEAGRLRIYFRDHDGNVMGDPRELSFNAGVFTATGEPTAEISATEGFSHGADFWGYKYKEDEFWLVEIYEIGASDSDSLRQLLARQDLSATLVGDLPDNIYD